MIDLFVFILGLRFEDLFISPSIFKLAQSVLFILLLYQNFITSHILITRGRTDFSANPQAPRMPLAISLYHCARRGVITQPTPRRIRTYAISLARQTPITRARAAARRVKVAGVFPLFRLEARLSSSKRRLKFLNGRAAAPAALEPSFSQKKSALARSRPPSSPWNFSHCAVLPLSPSPWKFRSRFLLRDRVCIYTYVYVH